MALEKLTSYLDEKGIKYVVVRHSKAFTAQEVAASAHIPGKEMVKTVMVKVDDDIKMFVLPSTHDVDFEAIKDTFDAENVELASESEFEDMFPDCEIGAMPPFGNLFDMDTYVAEVLTEDEKIAFNAGTHKEVVKMNYKDFEDLVNPEIVPIAVRAMS
ncbi:aminoacyl-tRNA deacylase [Rhodohalobacter sulfatireducens]|uniref:YbaK/EbsC family protein n=1 Tax=Rhodohalobacter sulfatireducens TaxID=2911366 RepID=A0ABS9KDE6_9BACT|nr:YbaK/EbsC family protein [Rhodohalobacter sulfatireducens]MCG2588868.1 YbaK/EbsC family protein [Rhodohalobacter sulfatireducens]